MTGMALLLVCVLGADDGNWRATPGGRVPARSAGTPAIPVSETDWNRGTNLDRVRQPVRTAVDSISNTARQSVNALSPLPGTGNSRSERLAATGSWRDLENVLSQPAPTSRSTTVDTDAMRSFGAAGKMRLNVDQDPLPQPPRSVAASFGDRARRGTDLPYERGRVRDWLDQDSENWEIPPAEDRRSAVRRDVARVDSESGEFAEDRRWLDENQPADDYLSGRSTRSARNRARATQASRPAPDEMAEEPLVSRRNSRFRDTAASSRASDELSFNEQMELEGVDEDGDFVDRRRSGSRSPNLGVFLPRDYESARTTANRRAAESSWGDERVSSRDYVTAPPREERIDSAETSARGRLNSADPFGVGPIPASEEPTTGGFASGSGAASQWPFESGVPHSSQRTTVTEPPRTSGVDRELGLGDGSAAGRALSDRPWWPFLLALMGLFASLGFNVYLGWIAWDLYTRYQDAIDDVQELEQRMEKQQQAALDAGPGLTARSTRSSALL